MSLSRPLLTTCLTLLSMVLGAYVSPGSTAFSTSQSAFPGGWTWISRQWLLASKPMAHPRIPVHDLLATQLYLNASKCQLERQAIFGDGIMRELVVRDDVLVGGTTNMLRVFDISHPEALRELASLDLKGHIEGLEWYGATVFVAVAPGGLRIVDLAVQNNPRLLGVFDPKPLTIGGGGGERLTVHDNIVYLVQDGISQNGKTLLILDTTAPEDVRVLGTVDLDNKVQMTRDVVYVSGAVYVINNQAIEIIDVRDPATPAKVKHIEATDRRVWSGMSTMGDIAYMGATTAGLVVFDISDVFSPMELVALRAPRFPAYRDPYRLDGLLYVPAGTDGIHIFDLSDPRLPSMRAKISNEADAFAIGVDRNKLYLTEGETGITVFDLAMRDKPQLVTHIDAFGAFSDVHVERGLLYAYSVGGRLQVWDVADPRSPRQVGKLMVSRQAGGKMEWTTGGIVIPGAQGQVSIVDVSIPESPTVAMTLRVPGKTIYDVSSAANRAMIVTPDGLFILNVDGPRTAISGHYALPEEYGKTVSDGATIFAQGETSVLVLNATRPEDIRVMGRKVLPLTNCTRSLDISEGNLVVGCQEGLKFIDVLDLTDPRMRFDFMRYKQVSATARDGDLLYVSSIVNFARDLSIWDLSQPKTPSVVGSGDATFMANGSLSEFDIQELSASQGILAAAAGSIVLWQQVGCGSPITPTPTATHPPPAPSTTANSSPAAEEAYRLLLPQLSKRSVRTR